MWVSHTNDRGTNCWQKQNPNVSPVFFVPLQVIKAALAQVKAVADGGVTAADLTQAK